MLKEKTKDVEINGKKYRIGRLDARTGSYVATKMAMLSIPLVGGKKEDQKGIDEEKISKIMTALSQRQFYELQGILLRVVQKLNVVDGNALPEPLLNSSGAFIDHDLDYDIGTVMALTAQTIMFNVGDFFGAAALAKMAKSN